MSKNTEVELCKEVGCVLSINHTQVHEYGSEDADYEKDFRRLDYRAIQSQINFLRGKVLTVIDAVIPSGSQNKCVKDLVHQQFDGQLKWIYELCSDFKSRMMMAAGEELPPMLEETNQS